MSFPDLTMAAVDPVFVGVGQSPGLEIWRIEKLKVVPQDPKTYGDFYSGDSYILLHTKKVPGSEKLQWDIHFWLGKKTSQDEQGVAAYKTVELDDSLGGGPVQHREVEEHESKLFLSYFKKGVRYLEGGVESGFKKVERGKYEKKLLQIKGKRNIRVKQVDCHCESLNQGDVFILDCGQTIFVWSGPRSSRTERIKGTEVARRIRDEERGGKAVIHIVDDDRWETDVKFFKVLGSKCPIRSAEEGGDDREFERLSQQDIRLFRVSDASGSLEIQEIEEKPFTQEHLDSNDCFILDSGPSGIWVWVGKQCTKNEKKSAWKNATDFLAIRGYPNWTKVTQVAENGEPPLFKQFFSKWQEPNAQVGMGKIQRMESIAKYSEEKFNTSELHRRENKKEENLPDDGSGQTKIWRIENKSMNPVREDLYGVFYSGDCYVILYTYLVNRREKYIIYFWQGSRSTPDERAASAFLAQMLDDNELAGEALQVRVVQNQEPEHFLRIFSGRMVILMGGINNVTPEGECKMYQVRGTNTFNTRAVQVPDVAASLNSNDVFVVETDYDTFLWVGQGSSPEEATMATDMIGFLSPNRQPVLVDEGNEPEDFWEALGGKGEYVTAKRLENTKTYVPPRLFQASNASGKFRVEEVVDFSQEDLCEDDVFLLDTFDEVYVWVGKGANAIEKKQALQTAKEYIDTDPVGRTPDSTLLLQVKQNHEPASFTCHFLGWDPDKWQHGKSYEDIKEELGAENAGVTLVDEELKKYQRTYSFDELKRRLPPEGVDVTNKENFLSDTEFEQIFEMDREKYDSLPRWKQIDLKKKVGLF
ncbi:gelsolin, cytoplasmic-like [Liolophura sinensis]|uniref:gelsolin, cytoplasmic-like n=1 Tax=Liolophura sinensis TaxID=3198878 RepID=UPI0031597C37